MGSSAGGLTTARGSVWSSCMLVVIRSRGEYFVAIFFARFVKASAVSSKRKGFGYAPQTASVAARATCKTENPNYCKDYSYLFAQGFICINSTRVQAPVKC
jgi:hypothetical protein